MPEDEDIATETSGLYVLAPSRPMANITVNWDACCNAPWTVVPQGMSASNAVDETTCDNATSYIWTPPLSDSGPVWAGIAFYMSLANLPVGKAVNNIRAFVCARPHYKYAPGMFDGKMYYWNPGSSGSSGHRYFAPSSGSSEVDVPAPSLFGSNVFKMFEVPTRISVSWPPSSGPKTATSQMGLYLFGDNVDISQVWLSLTYEASSPPPF